MIINISKYIITDILLVCDFMYNFQYIDNIFYDFTGNLFIYFVK